MKCPYETEVSLLLTTDEEIKRNKRGCSGRLTGQRMFCRFRWLEYETPGDFSFG
ncbi:MAG: hypothetical protein ACLRMN_10200 [Mediterraneibacter gnavus]